MIGATRGVTVSTRGFPTRMVIRCRVDLYAFFVCFFVFCFVLFFFSDVLTYCVMLQAFMLLFFRQMFLMSARTCVCMLFIGIVQRS